MYRSWLQPALARERLGLTVGSQAISGRLPPLREDPRLDAAFLAAERGPAAV